MGDLCGWVVTIVEATYTDGFQGIDESWEVCGTTAQSIDGGLEELERCAEGRNAVCVVCVICRAQGCACCHCVIVY